MRRFLLTVIILATTVGQALAQSFDRTNWDFGSIDEAFGVVSHVFVMRNTTDKPIRITGSVPSCNCIMAQLPDNLIAPGQTADIPVFFSPSGAVGPTHRTIDILGPKGVSLGTLSTDADVTPEDRSIEERYPIVLAPSLYANMNTIPFGYMAPGEKASKVIYLANSSKELEHIDIEIAGSGLLQVQCPEMIAPGQEVPVMLTYTMPADQNFQSHYDTISVTLEGSEMKGDIRASAICLTKGSNGPTAPRMRVFPNIGTLKAKPFSKTLHGTIEITNDGKEELVIQAIEAPITADFSIEPGTRIQSGKTVKAELITREKTTVRIFTNDPIRPYKDIIFNQ